MDLITALSPEHYEELIVGSAIDPGTVAARGYRTLTGSGEDRDLLESLGFKPYVWNRDDAYPGLLIPMHDATGEARGHQFKPASPRMRPRQDKPPAPVKYESPKGAELMVDVPAVTRERLSTPGQPLWITEGMKKVDSLVSRGVAAVGLTGVFNWRNAMGSLGDWEDVPIKGRPVVVCFDADANGNRNVQLAMGRLGAWLRTRGASVVHYLVVPAQVEGTDVKGVDDYFAAGGDLDGLSKAATKTPPGAGEKGAEFTDAFLVEELAEALSGRFCWASGLGWLRWTGRVWKEVSDVEPLEAVRMWASDQFERILTEQRTDPAKNLSAQIAGWRAILGKSRLTALRDLAKGLLQRDAAEFDGDPDLLTVLNGTLHLPTGKLLPFDPEHCITKSCDADYRRGFTHPAWTAALRAVPGDLHPWYQDRLGQALTGYPTPDHTLVIGCGTGSNGKSTVADVVRRTMGGYGVLVSDRVLMANPDAHPTELMDLRGARYAVMEETPEARHLNVQRLKTTLGTPSIRARHIRMDTVEFITSHSLFINTNYKPVVTETDWGTWRRLALMTFPFTFRKPGAALEGPWERVGDPTLAYASNDPEVRSAALAWMAEGAREWYRRGRMMLAHPETVERHTREWRAETDLILGFSDECLKFAPESFTQTRDMLTAFNEWAGERGHRPWNDRTFATRFGDHDSVRANKVRQGRFTVGGKQQRGWSGVEINRDGMDPMTGERGMGDPPAPEFELCSACADPACTGCDWERGDCPACGGYGCLNCAPMPDEHDPSGSLLTSEQEEAFQELIDLRQDMESDDIFDMDCVCGYPKGDCRCEADHDASCLADPDQGPVALGFDLETADADRLFLGGHEGPFVRLAGAAYPTGVRSTDHTPETLTEHLNKADVIYGHNILGFDLLALAHHHGADYDALAAKAVDTRVLAYLIEPPAAKAANVGYDLDSVAQRLGHVGKTDDLKALARKHGGFDRIPVDDPEYNDYLRGDLAATKAVYEGLRMLRMGDDGNSPSNAQIAYAEREMKVVTLQNRMTLNGWAADTGLLTERAAEEDAKRLDAIQELHERYGVPLAAPDRFKLLPKAQWPREFKARDLYRNLVWEDVTEPHVCDESSSLCTPQGCWEQDIPTGERRRVVRIVARNRVGIARRYMNLFPEAAEARGLAVRIPGKVHTKPWVTVEGKAAIVRALNDAGARYVPLSPKSGTLLTSADALGEGTWYCTERRRAVKGMLHPDAYGGNDAVRAVVDVLLRATGVRDKYNQVAKLVSPQGRVHGFIGAPQGSGRWAMSPFTTMGKRTPEALHERDVLVADPGHVLITCDHSQLDVRTVAALSQDPELIGMLQPGMDYHSEMAEVYCGDRGQRNAYKPVSHGTTYGMQAHAIAEQYGLDERMVADALRASEDRFHVRAAWMDGVREQAAAGMLLDNGFGRLMRATPERAFTQAPALMGQGASRDVMCESLLRLDALTGGRVRPYLRAVVHDEIVVSVPEAEAEEWARYLREAMTWEWKGVPILCDVSKPAFRWSECK